MVDFEEWPVAGLHCQTTDFHDLAGLVAPAAGAGGHHVEKGGALGINGFGSLSVQVFEVFCQGCLGCVRHVVLSDDGGEIFAVLDLSAGAFAGRCRRCVREHGSGRRALDSGIHVGAVVITYVDHVVSALHGAGQRLKTNVIGSAVPAEGDELEILFFRKSSSLAECPVSCLHAAQGRSRIFKGIVNVAVLPGGVRVHIGGDFQAARGVADDGPVFRMKGAQHGAHTDGSSAAGAHAVAGSQTLRPLQHGFEAEILLIDRCCIIYIAHCCFTAFSQLFSSPLSGVFYCFLPGAFHRLFQKVI